MPKLHSSLEGANVKFLPAALLKTGFGFALEPLISDTDYFQHSHRAAAGPVLSALYSVPEPILAQLPETLDVYTCDTQNKAVDFSRINTENVLCLVLVCWFFLISVLFAVLTFSCSIFQLTCFILFPSKYFTGQKHFNCLEHSSLLGSICMDI